MRVVGIDTSLTGTGVACFVVEGDQVETSLKLISTKGTKKDTLKQRQQRLDYITAELDGATWAAFRRPADLAVIESPSYGSQNGAQHDRSGLWWMVVDRYIRAGIPVATVAPQGRAKYGTGKGNAPKDAVLAAAVKGFPHLDIDNNNVADAVLLAAMGCRRLGFPVDDRTLTQLEAMDGAAWPA